MYLLTAALLTSLKILFIQKDVVLEQQKYKERINLLDQAVAWKTAVKTKSYF